MPSARGFVTDISPYPRQVKAGKEIEALDLFGPTVAAAGSGVSKAGRPRLPTRLMVALLYLKHAFNESDEDVVQLWGETPTWRYFSNNECFKHRWPCDPTQLGRFRKALGEEGVAELMARANGSGDESQTHCQEGTSLRDCELHRAGEGCGPSHRQQAAEDGARQGEVGRKMGVLSQAVGNRAKLYIWHTSQVEFINKGKKRRPFELGVKVGLAMAVKGNLIVSARSFAGDLYDGHKLVEQIEQSPILMQGLGVKPQVAYVDLGYRGVEQDNPQHCHRAPRQGQAAHVPEERRLLKRRQVIEPIIGSLKADHRMDRCHLKGSQGDACGAVRSRLQHPLAARMIVKKDRGLLLYLLQTGLLVAIRAKLAAIIGCKSDPLLFRQCAVA